MFFTRRVCYVYMAMTPISESRSRTTSPWTPCPVLGIESSCDETSAAILSSDGTVLSNIVASQDSVHRQFGGVVPELAARAHLSTIDRVVQAALAEAKFSVQDLGAIAVTQGPGLAGALLVGLNYAKGLAHALSLPIIGVNHLEGHIASAWLADPSFPYPCIVLVVSGGHTHLFKREAHGNTMLLGCTRDDAAGEAFDKGAQMLGLDYPGGPAIDRLARQGNPKSIRFPLSRLRKSSLEFSFSGLKTSLLYRLREMDASARTTHAADLAAGYQEAIVRVLVDRAFVAVRSSGVNALAVVGGVSANSRLRALLTARAQEEDVRLALPPMAYCTDNAAMIASAGRQLLMSGQEPSMNLEIVPSLRPGTYADRAPIHAR